MKWRPSITPTALTGYDSKLLPKLLCSVLLADVRDEISAILSHDDKGDYEQETLDV